MALQTIDKTLDSLLNSEFSSPDSDLGALLPTFKTENEAPPTNDIGVVSGIAAADNWLGQVMSTINCSNAYSNSPQRSIDEPCVVCGDRASGR